MSVTAARTDAAQVAVTGETVMIGGRRFYRIGGYHALPPFFMTVLGASDLWLFISSTGGLTAGRSHVEQALFPYTTDDKITESAGHTGGFTAVRVDGTHGPVVWQPFAPTRPGDPAVERALYKDDLGTELIFEETRPDLALTARVTWQTSGRYGIVRTTSLENHAADAVRVTVLDGFLNLLAAGISQQTQNELSVLLDAYKRAELDEATGLGMFYLNSTLTDRAEPSESLSATVAFNSGLKGTRLLSATQIEAFLAGSPTSQEDEVRGERGAYLTEATLDVPGDGTLSWRTVADTPYDAGQLVALLDELASPDAVAVALDEDITRTRTELEALVASSDGMQASGEELAAAHHSANVLFNIMRGGVPAEGSVVRAQDVRTYIGLRSPATATRQAAALGALPETTTVRGLIAAAEGTGDADLIRLAREYLPVAFSRRHGDPSRPWNRFRIAAHDEHGNLRIDYQGNWRDILQNWEALSWSFPELVESMIQVMLDATTADGYNPYRISRDGIDWEVPEPDNPWANIGYWSDHQIVYLLRLLENSQRFHPGLLTGLLSRAIFTHADVPYRIADYPSIVRDPKNTIDFDLAAQKAIEERVAREGADGRLLHTADGSDLVRVSLAEKLLGLLAAKLVNLVPDGGIWMNTQRPEWNDANNALVGNGLSIVTLAQLRRYVAFVRELLTEDVELTAELARLLTDLSEVLLAHVEQAAAGFAPAGRREIVDALGTAGGAYRTAVYAGLSGATTVVPASQVHALLDAALAFADAGVRANKRPDGLYHSYNVLVLGEGTAHITHLSEMLEGQVNVLGAGLLTPEEAADLLAALRASALFRADQHTYILYPNRTLPRLLEKNRVPADKVSPLLARLADSRAGGIALRDAHGTVRYGADMHNEGSVAAALAALPAEVAGSEAEQAEVVATFGELFNHAEFTGRSGSFFAYEGLGSIYWHMVSKLLLAVQENVEWAVAAGAPAEVVDRLRAAYEDVRHGIGYTKGPEVYGAFPIDPYSHTPAGKGAKQPGMTGQVKEEVLTRLGELGLRVDDGQIVFTPVLLRPSELTTAPLALHYRAVDGSAHAVEVPVGGLAFTFAGVPVVYRAEAPLAGLGTARVASVVATLADGSTVSAVDRLDAATSAAVLDRTGSVVRVDVTLV